MVQVRRVETIPFEDDELAAQGYIDEDDVELDRDVLPGEKLFDYNVAGGAADGRFDGTMLGDDPRNVVIYDIEGRPFGMPRKWAEQRLQKRYPPSHPTYPNKRVFYRRPPKEFPQPTVPCPSVRGGGCRKMLYNEHQAREHFQRFHRDEWQEREAEKQRRLSERAIEAQERQAELLARVLERLSGVESPRPVEELVALVADAAADVVADVAADAAEPEAPFPPGEPDQTWTIEQMRAWCEAHDVPLPKESFPRMSKKAWLEHIDQELGR